MRKIKDSGVAWIGVIPENWQLLSVGALFKVRNEKVNDTDYPPLSVTKGGIVPQMESVAKSDATDNRKMVLKNDFVINSRSDRKQSCGVSPLDGSVSLINTVLYPVPNAPVLPDYLDYLLKNYGFAEEFYRWGHGIVADLWTTRWQEMKNIFLPIPPVEEQQKIIFSISTQMGKVDALIANVQEQIEKLKAYKQSLITEVVTKGLDPNVPMKDSGVEWIGAVPNHWSIVRLKYLYDYSDGSPVRVGPFGSSLSGSDIIDEGMWIYNQRTVLDKNFENNTSFVSVEKARALDSFSVFPNDILITTRGSIGKTAVVPSHAPEGILHPCVIRFRVNDSKILRELISLIFNETKVCLGQILDMSNSTTIEVLYSYSLKEIQIPCPPLNEQQEILKRIQEIISNYNYLISLKQSKIEKLEQYKRSLIYEYVTGKKEVS